MKKTPEDIIKLIEKASGIQDLLSREGEINTLLQKFSIVEEYLKRFNSLEELTEHLTAIEDKLFVCKTYLSTQEAVKYLSICRNTLLEATRRREIPYYTPPSKSFYFSKEDLDNWIKGFRVSTLKEAEEEYRRDLIDRPIDRKRRRNATKE